MTATTSFILTAFLFAPAEFPALESKHFSRVLQHMALGATVRVLNKTQPAEGSGVIVRQQGAFVYVLTAGHLVEKAETVTVLTYSAKSYPDSEKVYDQAQVMARSREPDLALLRLATRDLMPGMLPLCPAAMVPSEKDFPGLSCGIQSGQPPTCMVEAIVGKKTVRKPGGIAGLVWEASREPASGRSGGPLIDLRGKVIGILSGRNEGKGYYTHLDEIYRFLKQSDAGRAILEGKD